MEKTIYKYQLLVADFQGVLLPIGSEILTIQTQGETVCMWALVNPNETQKEIRNIEIFGTGHSIYYDIGIDLKYISTFQIHGGQLVFHAFERTN
jgi:hypothetical protein